MANKNTKSKSSKSDKKKAADLRRNGKKAKPSKEFTDLSNAQAWERGESFPTSPDESEQTQVD